MGVVRLLYGQPRDSRSILYRAKKLIHHRKGISRLLRIHTRFFYDYWGLSLLGYRDRDVKLVIQFNMLLSLRKFGAILQIPYITSWLTQVTLYLNFAVLIHHL